ncbi:MAG: PEP/pyruvate-binding domain-containing protein [Erysipelotrichaceae bacterium]
MKQPAGAKAYWLNELVKKNINVPHFITLDYTTYLTYQDQTLDLAKLESIVSEFLTHYPRIVIRSSSSCEDQNDFSYAGQFESYLDITSWPDALDAIQRIYESATQATVYQQTTTTTVQMGIIIQTMVTPHLSGVAFSCDPITFASRYTIESSQGTFESSPIERTTFSYQQQPDGAWQSQLWTMLQRIRRDVAPWPFDVEWVYDGSTCYVVQVRPITVKKKDVYSNYFTKQFLPGMIKPSVYAINIPSINLIWKEQLALLTNQHDIDATRLATSFYYRVYFNMGYIGRLIAHVGFPDDVLERISKQEAIGYRFHYKQLRLLPGVVRFLFQLRGHIKQIEPVLVSEQARWKQLDTLLESQPTKGQLLEQLQLHQKAMKDITRLNILIPILASITIKNQQKKLTHKGLDPSYEAMLDHSQLLFDYRSDLLLYQQDQITLSQFLERYGHFCDNGNDCSLPALREREADIQALRTPLPQTAQIPSLPVQKGYKKLLTWHVRRENVSGVYTKSYSYYHRLLLALAAHLVDDKTIDEPYDIFYLEPKEWSLQSNTRLTDVVAKRKQSFIDAQDLVLKAVIYEDERVFFEPHSSSKQLMGLAVSAGSYRGVIQQVTTSSAQTLAQDAILLIPYSDISWMPILTQAKAILVESGGYLSHTAIIARELQIPCIILPDHHGLVSGQHVSMNGRSGEIHIEQT